MWLRWATFVLWALVAASAVGWGLKLFVTAPPAPRDARVADASLALRGELTRVLGADPVAPSPDSGDEQAPVADARFQLLGVVAPRARDPRAAARQGVALIAVDGKPPRAYRVGAQVDENTVLKSVRARGADLGPRDGAATIALEIPPPAPAATSTVPPSGRAAPPAGASTVRPGPVPTPLTPRSLPVPGVPPPVMAPPPAVVPPPVAPPNLQPQPPSPAAPGPSAPATTPGSATPEALLRS